MSKLCKLMIFVAAFGFSFASNVFAADEAVPATDVSTVAAEAVKSDEVTPVVVKKAKKVKKAHKKAHKKTVKKADATEEVKDEAKEEVKEEIK